jgi:hypothetical protein
MEKLMQDLTEKLNPSMGIKKYIDDFKKSDAPQFKGKSDKERRDMAIAAYMQAKEEVEQVDELKKSTLGSYIKKASDDARNKSNDAIARHYTGRGYANAAFAQKMADNAAEKRKKGIRRAVDKLTREEIELDEAKDQYVVMDRKTGKAVTKPMGMQQALDAYDGRGGNAKGLAVVKTTDKRLKEEVELDEDYSKKSTASLQKTHDKWKDRPMSPASANELKAIRRELQKRGALRKEEVELDEAKATMCGRCGTKHVKPQEGGTCPALSKEQNAKLRSQKESTMNFFKFREYLDEAVQTADKKPQNYSDPVTGKTKTRMVPVDNEIVKTEAADPYKGQPTGVSVTMKHKKTGKTVKTDFPGTHQAVAMATKHIDSYKKKGYEVHKKELMH